MLGANAVHMTLLHELIALASGYKLGMYHVFSNNCHVYTWLPRFTEIYHTVTPKDIYRGERRVDPISLLDGCDWETFLNECEEFLLGSATFSSVFLQHVAYPMKMAYLNKSERHNWIDDIIAPDWHRVASDWVDVIEGS